MADAMQYPELLDDPNPYGVWRCFVSAEAQSHHGLHRIYRRWTYRSVFEADPS